MKSCFAGWNPSELGWNLRCATSDLVEKDSEFTYKSFSAFGTLNRKLRYAKIFTEFAFANVAAIAHRREHARVLVLCTKQKRCNHKGHTFLFGAGDGTWTRMLKTQVSEACLSANSNTPAKYNNAECKMQNAKCRMQNYWADALYR